MPSSYSRVVFRSDTVEIGRFSVAREDPSFTTAGSIDGRIELVFPSVAVRIEQEGQRPFVADACRVVWYQPWQRFERRALANSGDHCDWIAFDPALVETALASRNLPGRRRELSELSGPGFNSSNMALTRTRLFGSIDSGHDVAGLYVEEAAMLLLQHAVGDQGTWGEGGSARAREIKLADKAREVIACRFQERLSLHEIAREVGCSPFYLARTFRKVTGHSLHGLQSRLRLRRGLQLLQYCTGELSRLSHELGYSSHSHFSAAFRREYGVTPASFLFARAAPSSPSIARF